MTKKILVLGRNGQLGLSLQKVIRDFTASHKKSNYLGYNEKLIFDKQSFLFASRNEIDLANSHSINNFFKKHTFNAIINFAAYTSVDKAENNKNLVDQINYFAVAQIAEIAKKQSIPLIHISTDYVFQGLKNKPYEETDVTNPQNIYGMSKLKGDEAILDSNCNGTIIRTSWLYSEFGNNFVKTMIELGEKKDFINVICDQLGCPTYALNLAKLVLIILNKNLEIKQPFSGSDLYHYSDEGFCSWYEFTKSIFKLYGLKCKVKPIKTKDYHSLVTRPQYSVLNKNKIKAFIPNLVIPHWQESLINCLLEIKKY